MAERGGGRIARRMPRTLAASAHVTAAACWVFVLGAFVFKVAIDAGGVVFVIALLVVLLPVVFPAMLVALAVAAIGATITLPLAVSWLRTPNREGSGGFALLHVAVAAVVGAFVLLRIATAS